MATKKRSVPATVIGILNILLALPCLACSGWDVVGQITDDNNANNPNPANVQNADPKNPIMQMQASLDEWGNVMPKEAPNLKTVSLISNVISMLASLILLVSGFMLIFAKPTGRLLCLLGATLLIASVVVEVGYHMVVLRPAAQKFDDQFEQKAKANGHATPFLTIAAVFLIADAVAILLGAGYPLFAIAVMMMPGVREALASSRPSDDDFDRPRDDFDDRPPDDFR
jgi:hypothetical protein